MEEVEKHLTTLKLEDERTLMIFDLNGILVEKKFQPGNDTPEGWSRAGKSIVRPKKQTLELFKLLFSENGKKKYAIGLWSSAFHANLIKMVQGCFPEYEQDFEFIWGQEKCDKRRNPLWISNKETPNEKPEFFWKCLTTVWREFDYWNPDNTLIFDDSRQKLERNPESCNIFLSSDGFELQMEKVIEGFRRFVSN